MDSELEKRLSVSVSECECECIGRVCMCMGGMG